MKVRCFYNVPWFWGKFFRGFTIYPFIFFKDKKEDVPQTLFRHEWEHVLQIRELGWFRFYSSYLIENIRVGYKENKYEVAAYVAQKKPLTPFERRTFERGVE
jgi:hypothetical protein